MLNYQTSWKFTWSCNQQTNSLIILCARWLTYTIQSIQCVSLVNQELIRRIWLIPYTGSKNWLLLLDPCLWMGGDNRGMSMHQYVA